MLRAWKAGVRRQMLQLMLPLSQVRCLSRHKDRNTAHELDAAPVDAVLVFVMPVNQSKLHRSCSNIALPAGAQYPACIGQCGALTSGAVEGMRHDTCGCAGDDSGRRRGVAGRHPAAVPGGAADGGGVAAAAQAGAQPGGACLLRRVLCCCQLRSSDLSCHTAQPRAGEWRLRGLPASGPSYAVRSDTGLAVLCWFPHACIHIRSHSFNALQRDRRLPSFAAQ